MHARVVNMKRLVYHIEFTDFLGYSQNVKLINNGQFVILRYDKIFIPQNARNSKRENPAKLHCKKFAKSSLARNPPNNQASVEKQ